jgi:glycosyltransferase involved in cell wall biosynthesis
VPLFSVVVPVYNVRDYLRPCLDSVLRQDFRDFEIIGVDDASTDDGGAILDEYAAADDRVRVFHLDRNVGLGAARNTGVDAAGGEYLVFVDSDDELTPGALRALAERLAAAGDVDVVVHSFVRVHEDGREEPDIRSAQVLAPDDTAPFPLAQRPELFHLFPAAWTKAVRREFAQKNDLAFAPGYYEDLPWTFPALITAQRIVTLNQPCYRYRQRSSGTILSSTGRRHLEIIGQFDRVFGYLDRHPQLERWRPLVYERMTRQLPTVLEMADRVPADLRREFFDATVDAFRRHRPADYTSSGAAAVRARLIERGDYRLYRAAEWANDLRRRIRTTRNGDGRRNRRPSPFNSES